MRAEILEKVTEDLLTIPPMTFRGIRRKLVKTALENGHFEITPMHVEIIRLLEEEGTLHAAEIGKRLQIAKAQMTQLIDKLVSMDIVARSVDPADRRTTNISLTGHGRETIAAHKSAVMNAVRERLSALGDAELEELSAALRKIRDLMDKLG
jgi:DNA-binding MarR family transcriptional regulator